MKTISCSVSVLLAVIFFSFGTVSALAFDVSVGGSMWVSKWEPFYAQSAKMASGEKVTIDPGLIAGPVVSVRFADAWSWGNSLLLGKYEGRDSLGGISQPNETWRADFDSTLNYSINRYVKVFGGFKYLYMDYTLPDAYGEGLDYKFTNRGYGPALCFSLTLPLTDSLFTILNLSGIYLKDAIDYSGGRVDRFNAYGGNSTLTLAYYFASVGVTASAGVRYQYLKYYEITKFTGMDETSDKFYGMIVSLICTF